MMSVANGFNSYSINIAMTTVALTTWGHNSFRLSDVLQLNTNRGYKQGAKIQLKQGDIRTFSCFLTAYPSSSGSTVWAHAHVQALLFYDLYQNPRQNPIWVTL